MTPDLTPTEDLLMELLIARIGRLGDPWWTFEYRHRKTLNSLEEKGLITTEPATTPHIEAHLTDLARERYLSSPYTSHGAKVEWAVQTADDSRPIRYGMTFDTNRTEEDYHRAFAIRHGGRLFRRAVPAVPWVEVPVEVDRG